MGGLEIRADKLRMGKAIPELARSYIPGIDGLRAVAVLSVVFYHLSYSIIPGVFAGVDIFFVISGYVISRSLASSKEKSLREFILSFYKRRILRIVPALLVCLVVTSIASNLFIPDAWLSDLNKWTGVNCNRKISGTMRPYPTPEVSLAEKDQVRAPSAGSNLRNAQVQ
jgi:peptidoglycan/LPS O-acetylase OafA/YrhL